MNILVKFKPFKDSFFLQLFSANFMSVIGDTIYRITLVYSAFFSRWRNKFRSSICFSNAYYFRDRFICGKFD